MCCYEKISMDLTAGRGAAGYLWRVLSELSMGTGAGVVPDFL